MVVLEAMAAGLPVIVSPNVGAKDLVIEGVNGFVIPDPKDVAAAAKGIISLIDMKRRNMMGEAAQHEANHHSWRELSNNIHKIYENKI